MMLAAVEHLELLHLHFAAPQRRVGFGALLRGQLVDPQQIRSPLQLVVVARFRQLHVTVERFQRVGVQLGRFRLRALREVRDGRIQRHRRQQDYANHSQSVAHTFHLSHYPVIVHPRLILNALIWRRF